MVRSVLFAGALLAIPAPACAQHTGTEVLHERATDVPEHFAPYAFLIGEWDVGPVGAAPQAITTFRWGPGKSYLWLATSLIFAGKPAPHFEGVLMWNGVHGHLDMLLTLDLAGGRAQESGRVYTEPDGTVVREITAYYSPGIRTPWDGRTVGPSGTTAIFRQTFVPDGSDRILTTIMRKTSTAWVPSFPGSENAVMKRRQLSGSNAE